MWALLFPCLYQQSRTLALASLFFLTMVQQFDDAILSQALHSYQRGGLHNYYYYYFAQV
ncbi:hypothetical protein L210DRAFT_3537250 [Boletus edulis BED1]|uniref:Uncharacterized protein n=1 Tax=Boletus edulis BED1 TaxID=1328754 RepID=A0AAD4BWU0_BOLED|nr:hypothetical protein L210DRAFT_3537250 [Boletus edulis BED1]